MECFLPCIELLMDNEMLIYSNPAKIFCGAIGINGFSIALYNIQ